MTALQITKVSSSYALAGLISLLAVTRAGAAGAADPGNAESFKYDKVVLAKISEAIARTDDPSQKAVLRSMRSSAEIGFPALFYGVRLDSLPPDEPLTKIPPEIGLLVKMRVVVLAGGRISTLPPDIGKLTSLDVLILTGNELVVLTPEIGKLVRLEFLGLSNNSIPKLPAEIGELTNLKELDLSWNKCTTLPVQISKLTKLAKLDLSGNPITDAGLAHLKSMVNLKSLDCRNTRVTKEGIEALQKALSKCRIKSDFQTAP